MLIRCRPGTLGNVVSSTIPLVTAADLGNSALPQVGATRLPSAGVTALADVTSSSAAVAREEILHAQKNAVRCKMLPIQDAQSADEERARLRVSERALIEAIMLFKQSNRLPQDMEITRLDQAVLLVFCHTFC